MKVLITGADGFVGKNLQLRLLERKDVEVVTYTRSDRLTDLPARLAGVDVVFHLAGVNRPKDPQEFVTDNADLTQALAHAVRREGRAIRVLLASSTQARLDNPYGSSKRVAEQTVMALPVVNGVSSHVFRLPNVFGKWCKPNYNSVVATFCHNKAHDLPVQISDSTARIRLVYVDDVVNAFLSAVATPWSGLVRPVLAPEYSITLGELSGQIDAFKNCRTTLVSERVGTGLTRALYATYVSYLPKDKFAYEVPVYGDARGVFVEMLKTPDAGQFSYFTAHPGVTRGGHYHNTKTEKFLVIKGEALFRFRNLLNNSLVEMRTNHTKPQIVDTIPGWTHDITNVGVSEMIVLLWANENFEAERPDTYANKV